MNSDSVLAFTKIILLGAIYYHKQGDVPKALVMRAAGWLGKASSFMNKVWIPHKYFLSLLKAMTEGDMDEVGYSMVDIGNDINNSWKEIEKDESIKFDLRVLIKDIAMYARTDSEPAFKRIEQRAGLVRDPELAAQWVIQKGGSQTKFLNQLERLVAVLTKGKVSGPSLPFDVAKQVSKERPEIYKEYLRLRREAMGVYKNFQRDYIRSSGKRAVKVHEMLDALKNKGIVLHTIPKGFDNTIYIGDDGSYYTRKGHKIAMGIGGGKVEMNPSYDHDTDNAYVFRGMAPGAVGWQRYYTTRKKLEGKTQREGHVKEFAQNIDRIRAKWISHLKSKREPQATLATMLEIAYQTAARIGNPSSAMQGGVYGGKSFGISTWPVRVARINGNTLILRYKGKKGVPQMHKLVGSDPVTKLVVQKVAECMEDKEPTDQLFTVRGRPLTAMLVNKYLTSLGSNVTVHKIRHAKADNLFTKIMEKCPLKPGKTSGNEALKWLKDQIGKVIAPALGHKNEKGDAIPTTSLNAYVSPSLQKEFFSRLKVYPMPTYLQKLTSE